MWTSMFCWKMSKAHALILHTHPTPPHPRVLQPCPATCTSSSLSCRWSSRRSWRWIPTLSEHYRWSAFHRGCAVHEGPCDSRLLLALGCVSEGVIGVGAAGSGRFAWPLVGLCGEGGSLLLAEPQTSNGRRLFQSLCTNNRKPGCCQIVEECFGGISEVHTCAPPQRPGEGEFPLFNY